MSFERRSDWWYEYGQLKMGRDVNQVEGEVSRPDNIFQDVGRDVNQVERRSDWWYENGQLEMRYGNGQSQALYRNGEPYK